MRKTTPFLLLLIVMSIIATSCNKTWNCECSEGGRVLQVTPIKSLGKYGAKSVCDSYQENNNRNGARQICQIK